MAKTTKTTKFTRGKRGSSTKTVTNNSITRRDLKSQIVNAKKEIAMAKLNNENYQKHVTRRAAGAEAAASIVTPTTVALSNTNAFSSGGFDISSQPNDKGDQSDSPESGSNNNSMIWG